MTSSELLAVDAKWRADLRRRLLHWFDRNARDLPWRRDPTPYHVWVSEIMLQQTQVATVVSYYERFLAAFPTVQSLAAADEPALMRIWEGLGYYRRARLMHQAAKRIVDEHGGEFPQDYETVLSLPGIGRYTAGAVLSISSDKKLPILEGNTVRVYSRWVAMTEDVKSQAGISRLWQIAELMLPKSGAGRFNQAAMELGALICKPISPRCNDCPVSKNCEAFRLGSQEAIPGKVTKMTYEDRREFAFVIPNETEDAWLMYRVPEGERWAGLWDFPRSIDGVAKTAKEAALQISRRTGLPIEASGRLTNIKHAVTRFRITLNVFAAKPVNSAELLATGEYHFATLAELESLPLSVTGRKIADRQSQK